MTRPGVRLSVHDGLGRRVVAIDKPELTIGRGAQCDVTLSGAEISRVHAAIVARPDGWELHDRSSRFGTFVNGVRVRSHRLAHGDQVGLGRDGAVLIFLAHETGSTEGQRPVVTDGLGQVAMLLGALREIGSGHVLDEVLTLVVDAAIVATGAERGFIMLANSRGELEMTLARGAGCITLSTRDLQISRKVPVDVFTTGRTMVVADLLGDDVAPLHTGTVALGIRQVLCAPLRLVRYLARGEAPAEPRNIGVLYMDSRERGALLSIEARVSLDALAGQAAIAIENARLYQEAIEKARIDEELMMASAIQQALLPESRRSGPFFEAVGASVSSRTIGGDFFDYQDLGSLGFGFGLGDVMGKGPPAALLTSLVQGVLATRAASPSMPDEVVSFVNRILLARRLESRYVTLFLGVLAPDGRLRYCNAGHNAPLLFTRQGVSRLDTGGTIVGAFADAVYERGEAQLAAGDTLVLFSDGVVEAEDAHGNQFGESGILDAVGAAPDRIADDTLDAVFGAVRVFTNGVALRDDLTAVVIRYRMATPA